MLAEALHICSVKSCKKVSKTFDIIPLAKPERLRYTEVMDYVYRYTAPLGELFLASDGKSLTGLCFGDPSDFIKSHSKVNSKTSLLCFDEATAWLDLYFRGEIPDFLPPLALTGSDFQRSVWECLLKIPYGSTRTYGEIAAEIAGERGIPRMSAQAVGGAVGRNPVPIIVPCHRVVGAHGRLGGYGGGLARKTWLLELEAGEGQGLMRHFFRVF